MTPTITMLAVLLTTQTAAPAPAVAPSESEMPASSMPIEQTTPTVDAQHRRGAEGTDLATGPGFGFALGSTSGNGLSYRQHFANGVGLQIAGIGFSDGSLTVVNLGVKASYTLAHSEWARFYGHVGALGLIAQPASGGGAVLAPGLGPGIEFHFTKHIGLALELPVAAFLVFERGQFLPEATFVAPIPNIALTYYF